MIAASDILLYTPEPASGASRYVYELARALTNNGWSVTLLAPHNFAYAQQLAEEGRVQLKSLGVRPNDSGRGRLRLLWDNLSFLIGSSVTQYCTMRRDQVIHIQFPLHLPFGLIPFVLARLSGCRIVFTAHDPLPHKWSLPGPLRRLELWSLGCQYRLSDRIIVHSAAGRQTVQDTFAVPARKLEIIAHGTFALEASVRTPSEGEALRVLLFGSLRENKGIHLAIEAASNLSAQGVRLELVIAGDTPNQKEEAYWATCEALLTQNTGTISVIKRYIPDSELPELLAACDCVLLPYTGFTSDSGVAALALSNAKPLLATAAGGLRELLGAAELGILIKDETVEGVEQALLAACAYGREELRRLGNNGAEYISRHRSWAVIADRTGDLYRRLPEA